MDDRAVTPDQSLLTQVFGAEQPVRTSIYLNDWDKCVFRAEFEDNADHPRPACVVRLEADNGNPNRFATVDAMQQIAATCIPHLVPKTYNVGNATNLKGRLFHFSIMELLEGQTLEEVWDEIDHENQVSITMALAEVLKELHSLKFSDDRVQEILRRVLGAEAPEIVKNATMGGQLTGFLPNGSALLRAIVQRWDLSKSIYEVEQTANPEGLLIKYKFGDTHQVSNSDMEEWSRAAVFCHNDLTPRNLILRPVDAPGGGGSGATKYQLAGIIDWELSGFYPPSYELSLQDTYLSGGNRRLSFYLLLKQQLSNIVPRTPAHMSLVRAIEFVYESQQRFLAEHGNIPGQIRQRFRHRLHLVRSDDLYTGWVCKYPDGTVPRFTRADDQALEDEVIEEVIARRQARSKGMTTS